MDFANYSYLESDSQSDSQSDRGYGINTDSNTNNNNITNKYNIFNEKFIKKNILIDSSNIKQEELTNPIIIHFDSTEYIHHHNNENFADSHKSSITNLKNVIGFKLIRAIIPYYNYNKINTNNNVLTFTNPSSSKSLTLTITPGNYTETELIAQFNNINNYSTLDPSGPTNPDDKIILSWNQNTNKFSFQNTTNDLTIITSTSTMNHILGLHVTNEFIVTSTVKEAIYRSDMNPLYIDLVIDELPYLICKENMKGNKIIERIPIDCSDANTINYKPESDDKYFYPITLNQLTISLYSDKHNRYFKDDLHRFSFEFEVTMYHNFDDLLEE